MYNTRSILLLVKFIFVRTINNRCFFLNTISQGFIWISVRTEQVMLEILSWCTIRQTSCILLTLWGQIWLIYWLPKDLATLRKAYIQYINGFNVKIKVDFKWKIPVLKRVILRDHIIFPKRHFTESLFYRKFIFPDHRIAERHFHESSFSWTSFSDNIVCPNVVFPKLYGAERRFTENYVILQILTVLFKRP